MATEFLAEKTVRTLFGVSRQTLVRWAAKGYGPPRRKIGMRKVGYDPQEVERFSRERPIVGACDASAKAAA